MRLPSNPLFCVEYLPSMPRDQTDRIELLQGTLDMLLLRTLQFGPAMDIKIAKHIQRNTEDLLQVEHGSLIRPCTGWSRMT